MRHRAPDARRRVVQFACANTWAILLTMKPSYDDETLAAYFQPLHPELWEDPLVGPILRYLAADDPDIIAAVVDVDRSQIRDCMDRTPEQRLRVALGIASTLTGFRRVPG